MPCLDIDTILEHLEKIKPGKWYCLIRAHSAVKRLDGINPRKNIIDVTEYEDMADLLLISDVLITDYSSTAGDFILQNKPVILYQPDYKEYLEKDRTFYFEAEKLPYWIAHSMSEIYKYIDDFSEKSILENCNKVKEFYKICESGHASEEVADYIYHYISGNQEGISLNVR